jgi:hypothetical protein
MNMEHYLRALKVIEAYAAAAQPQAYAYAASGIRIRSLRHTHMPRGICRSRAASVYLIYSHNTTNTHTELRALKVIQAYAAAAQPNDSASIAP